MVINKLLSEMQYAGCIPYFALLAKGNTIGIEQNEHYVKSTFRNRCFIANPNGLLTLSVPLKRGRNQRRKMKEMEISNVEFWQKDHWYSLTASYRRSPFFEYYEDGLYPFYHNTFQYLFDFNEQIFNWLLQQLDMNQEILKTDHYVDSNDLGAYDFDARSMFKSNLNKTIFPPGYQCIKYNQVFQEKIGFIPHLSIFDLLFAEGKNAKNILMESISSE